MLRNAEKMFSSSNGNPRSGEEVVPHLNSDLNIGNPLYLHSRSASREDQIQRNASTELGPRLPNIHKPGANADRQAKVTSAGATQAGFFTQAKKRAAFLKQALGRTVELNEFEQLLAANVVNPSHIDVTIEEVNGLDKIVEEMVSCAGSRGRSSWHCSECRQASSSW